MERLEGWGEGPDNRNGNDSDDDLPESWWTNHRGEQNSNLVENMENKRTENKQNELPSTWRLDEGEKEVKVTEVKAAPRLVVRRGKLKPKEIVKLKKSNKSIMGWLTSREGPPMHETQEEIEDMEWADLEKEVMLARVRSRQMEWATNRMCRSLVVGIMNTAVEVTENQHIAAMLTSVLEEVWKRVEVTRLLGEIERNLEVQRRIEKELVRRKREEDELVKAVLSEENKQKIK